MPLNPDTTRSRFAAALEELNAVGTSYRANVQRIRNDDTLTDIGKTKTITAAKAEALSRVHVLQQAAVEALADHNAALQLTANPPTRQDGIEGVAARIEAADARARVRGLLAQGFDPVQIIARANDTADLGTLDALRAEAQWMNPGSSIPEGLVARIDDARADLVPEAQGAAIREEAQFTAQRASYLGRIRRAETELDSGPTLAGAVADHYAGIGTPSEPSPTGDAA